MLETVSQTEQVHEAFRCWLTTEPHPQFSINVLQLSIKYTFEPPQGVKAGLKRTFAGLTQVEFIVSFLNSSLDKCSMNSRKWLTRVISTNGRLCSMPWLFFIHPFKNVVNSGHLAVRSITTCINHCSRIVFDLSSREHSVRIQSIGLFGNSSIHSESYG
jgi:hypothetical protein